MRPLSLAWVPLLAAAVSAAPAVYVDSDWRSATVEYSHPVQAPTFRIAIRITGATSLDSYAFDLGYDTAKVAFVGASAGSPGDGAPNILETRGGSAVAFVGRVSARDTTRITVGNALAGSDSSRSPSGDGVLALLDFRAKALGMARFYPGKVELLDWKQELDTTAIFQGGSVDIQGAIAVRRVARMEDRLHAVWIDPLGRRVAGLPAPASRAAAPGRLIRAR